MNIYPQSSALRAESFKKTLDGKPVRLIHLTDGKGLQADVTNYGGKIVTLITPDRHGNPVDVVLGHDTLGDYIQSEEQYFGSIIGRYGNRIANGRFEIDGETFLLPINNGPNCLHGGYKGFNAKVWDVVEQSDIHVVLSVVSPDGEEGFPGEVRATVTYTLRNGELEIDYEATTTKPTVINLTNHSYFNLSGEGVETIHDHELKINSTRYLPTNEVAIPYGDAKEVAGTPFDFVAFHEIGERIDEDIDQLRWARGYDHTYILDQKAPGEYGVVADCRSPRTGIRMEVLTTEPGMQLYTGNWMTGNMRGKGESRYPARSAVCFETQHYPDSPNKPEYPTTVLRPGKTYRSKTSYRFGVTE